MAENVLENPGKALEIGAKVGTAVASRSPKAALSSVPEVTIVYHTGNGLHLVKFVWFYAIWMEQKTPIQYPSAPPEIRKDDLEHRFVKNWLM